MRYMHFGMPNQAFPNLLETGHMMVSAFGMVISARLYKVLAGYIP
jgi:hypothetical protein